MRDLHFLIVSNCILEAVCCINTLRTVDVPALLLNTGFSSLLVAYGKCLHFLFFFSSKEIQF